jgi:hypothetical protein
VIARKKTFELCIGSLCQKKMTGGLPIKVVSCGKKENAILVIA